VSAREPTNPSSLEQQLDNEINDQIALVGAASCCTTCLGSVLLHRELRPRLVLHDGDEEVLREFGVHYAECWVELFARYADSPAAAWLHIFASVGGFISAPFTSSEHEPLVLSEGELEKVIARVRSHHPDLDFAKGLPHWLDRIKAIRRFLQWLGERGEFHPSKVIDLKLLIAEGASPGMRGDSEDPRRLEWWLSSFGWDVLPHIFPLFRDQPDDVVGPLARAIDMALWMWQTTIDAETSHTDPVFHDWIFEGRVPVALAAALAPYLDVLLARAQKSPNDRTLARMCWRYAHKLHGLQPDGLAAEHRARLKKAACDELGRMRVLAREAHTQEAAAKFQSQLESYDDAVTFVGRFGSLWEVLKPLLLAFRALTAPAVARDLRYWYELKLDEPPATWYWIPHLAAAVIHTYAGKEEKRDTRLEGLRREFSAFCLERLKTTDNGGQMEPSAAWRRAYIGAARELRVNPRGRGHHVLNWAREHDPDEAVRAAAAEAYSELRHEVGLPEKRSARRAILAAMWHLRRAHLIELRGPDAVDDRGALRTRNREGRRTLDAEQEVKRK